MKRKYTMFKNPLCFIVAVVLMLVMLAAPLGCQKGNTTEELSFVTVYYTTDTHGHIMSDASSFGLETISALHKNTENSVLVDCGDYIQGMPIANLTRGENVIAAMKQAGYFAAALGNHEFDYGVDILDQRIAQAQTAPNKMNIIAANIFDADDNLLYEPYAVTTVGGLKIGFYGLTTPETFTQAVPGMLDGLVFKSAVDASVQAVADLKAAGCNLIVALSHIGSDDYLEEKSEDVAAVNGVDIVIDGHSHRVLDTTVGSTTLVSSGEFANNIGKLVVTYNQNKQIKTVDNSLISMDTDLKEFLDEVQAKQTAELGSVVFTNEYTLTGDKQTMRTAETNLGDMVADSYLFETGADVALVNSGGVRTTLNPGDITKEKILEVLPFGNRIVTKNLTGAQLKALVEHSIAALPAQPGAASGQFMQIGGFKYTADLSKPAENRISSLTLLDGTPITDNMALTVATVEYIALGGDGFPAIGALPEITKSHDTEDIILINYIEHLVETNALSNYAAPCGRITLN